MGLRRMVVDEGVKFAAMVPVRLTKMAGWLLEWPISLLGSPRDQASVFVVAVPRSGSTLLYNLIAWNEDSGRQVSGYGENCASYRRARDTRRLRVRTMLYLRRRPPSVVADKLVQSRYRLTDVVLTDPDCYFIFIDRAEPDVVASIEAKLKLTRRDAEALYRVRSQEVADLRSRAVNRLTVSYEQLLDDPDAVLARISEFLKLGRTLSNRYLVPPNVGNFSYGDDGRLIRSGEIIARSDSRRRTDGSDPVTPRPESRPPLR